MKNGYSVSLFWCSTQYQPCLFALFYFWVIRCSVGAMYTVAFSFTVLCQLFTFSVICYFHHAHCFIYIFFMMLSLSPKGHDM